MPMKVKSKAKHTQMYALILMYQASSHGLQMCDFVSQRRLFLTTVLLQVATITLAER